MVTLAGGARRTVPYPHHASLDHRGRSQGRPAPGQGTARGAFRGGPRPFRGRGRRAGERQRLRRHHPRPPPSRRRRPRGVPGPPPSQHLHADPRAHGPGLAGRSGHWAQFGSRRLPGEALRLHRIARPHPRAAPALRADPACRSRGRGSHARSDEPSRHPRWTGHRRDAEGVRHPRGAHAFDGAGGEPVRSRPARVGDGPGFLLEPRGRPHQPSPAEDRSTRRRAPDPHRPRARLSPGAGVMKLHLNLKARAVVLHVVAAGLILGFASLGTNWFFSRMVLGQFDQSLLELFKTEASSILADPAQSLHVHEMPARSGPPSFPRLDKFVQVIELDGHVLSRSANLGSARLPASPVALARLRNGEEVLETLRDFGDEPVRVLSARWLFLLSSTAILVAIGLAGALLAWAILRPIDRIVRRARGIGALALAERLPHPGGHDEIARLVETLNEMLGRIEQAFEGQRRFTADASHELRSPLSRLRAELEVTLRRPRQRDEYEDTLRSCLDEVERLSRLTEELLTLARLDAGEAQELPASPVPLAPILAEVVTRMEPDAHERGVEIVVDAAAGLTVNVAPGTAALVVANVLDNAVKYSPRGGRVRVDAVADNGAAVVAISDAGPGVTEEEIPHLFERFYRGSAARRSDVPGTGLGLAICRIVAEAQGGAVTVSSGPNGGAVFHVRLPLAA